MKLKLISIALMTAVATPALAHGPIPVRATATEEAALARDRADILAMAGNFKVKFDFQETTPWRPGYTPIAPKTSGGHEVVRVIEDTGRRISLQHLLVVDADGKTSVIKHWRQDWVYEPETVLVYAGPNKWALEAVPEKMRKGRWSQMVWQTDDSPRYGGWGQWEEQSGVRRWRSNWTWRPLARRDAVRDPVYDRYQAINRHSPTPTGWIHWQDNTKMGVADGKVVPFVQETVLNTYSKFDGFPVKAADDYWAKTKDYWAAVRTAWNDAITRGKGVMVLEEAENGSVTGPDLMGWADDIAAGTMTTTDGVAKAQALIAPTALPVK
jgi:hypothetical protein